MSTSNITLREMTPDDGPALKTLMENDPASTGMSLTTRFLVNPFEAWTALQPDMVGVVAETDDVEGLVGVATLAFDTIQFEGEPRPAAFLENLKVHHAHRGRGLGTQLAQWRIDTARERFGDDGVIMTGTTATNTASLATMKKWCKQFHEGMIIAPGKPRATPPRKNGLGVRPPQSHELENIAEKSNQFYADYNLYSLLSGLKLSIQLNRNGVQHYRVAVTPQGEIVAGILLSLRSALMVDEFRNVPPPVRIVNRVTSMIPADNQLRLLETAFLWFDDVAAGRFLWDHIRWEFREQANTISSTFDPRGPLADVFQLKPWHFPKLHLVLAINGPVLMGDERLVSNRTRG